jgi:hypothetical protein
VTPRRSRTAAPAARAPSKPSGNRLSSTRGADEANGAPGHDSTRARGADGAAQFRAARAELAATAYVHPRARATRLEEPYGVAARTARKSLALGVDGSTGGTFDRVDGRLHRVLRRVCRAQGHADGRDAESRFVRSDGITESRSTCSSEYSQLAHLHRPAIQARLGDLDSE